MDVFEALLEDGLQKASPPASPSLLEDDRGHHTLQSNLKDTSSISAGLYQCSPPTTPRASDTVAQLREVCLHKLALAGCA